MQKEYVMFWWSKETKLSDSFWGDVVHEVKDDCRECLAIEPYHLDQDGWTTTNGCGPWFWIYFKWWRGRGHRGRPQAERVSTSTVYFSLILMVGESCGEVIARVWLAQLDRSRFGYFLMVCWGFIRFACQQEYHFRILPEFKQGNAKIGTVKCTRLMKLLTLRWSLSCIIT